MQTITPVKPRSGYRHYSNPACQGSLIRSTRLWLHSYEEGDVWTRSSDFNDCFDVYEARAAIARAAIKESPCPIPEGLKAASSYLDRMREWDGNKFQEACKCLSKGLDSPDDELIAFVKAYFDVDAVAVRTVYYFNQSNGYDCPRVDYLYKG
jgi:hypothetical protein